MCLQVTNDMCSVVGGCGVHAGGEGLITSVIATVADFSSKVFDDCPSILINFTFPPLVYECSLLFNHKSGNISG